MSNNKRDVAILETRVQPSGHFSKKWDITIPEGHTLDDLMRPEYWAHTSRRFNPGDLLYVFTDDEIAHGEFYVTSCGANHATLFKKGWWDLSNAEKQATKGEYAYKWKGPTLKHCVVRVSDNHVVVNKLPTKDAAVEWIQGQKKVA